MFNFWPVIVREVRSASRQPTSYWIRLTAVALTLLIFFLIWFGAQLPPQQLGRQLFNTMSLSMFCGIWIIAPLLSADCISREKRDGTLGLLFLTPLKAFDIVVAKIIAQALRTGTMLVAAIPALLLPVLIGGVSWMDGLRAVLINLSALFIALAIGVAASTFCKRWMMAVITSLLISGGIACLFVWIYLLIRMYPNFQSTADFWKYALSPETLYNQLYSRLDNLLAGLSQTSTSTIRYSTFQGTFWMPRGTVGSSAADVRSVLITGGMFILSLLGILCVLIFSAVRLNHFWKDHPASKRQLWLLKVFCSPVFWKEKLRTLSNRKLSSNPIFWLQTRSWSARLFQWGWLLVVVILEVLFLNIYLKGFGNELPGLQTRLMLALTAGMAFTAVSSFRLDRQNGGLELILVTPLSERQIINGRLLGIWKQFWLAIVLVLGVDLFSFNSTGSFIALLMNMFAVSAIGLFFSLTRLNVLAAWGLTILTGLILPTTLLQWVLNFMMWISDPSTQSYFRYRSNLYGLFLTCTFLVQLAFGFFALDRLRRKLTKRAFQFG